MTSLRRTAATLLVAALAGAGVVLAAAPAEAVSSYRYWSYWYAAPAVTSWTYGQIGPAGHPAVDGSVEGWRFVVAAPNPSAPKPGLSPAKAFQRFCGGTTRPTGQVRVAVVVDFGTTSDAPPHESPPGGVTGTCALVPEGSKGLTALAAYHPRIEGGLVCGLAQYPAHECGVVVKQASPTPTPSPTRPRPTKSAVVPPPTHTSPPSASSGPSATTGADGPGQVTPTPTPSASGSASPGSATPTPSTSASGDAALAVGGPPPPAGGSGSGTPAGLLLGGALVIGVAAAAVLRTRGGHHGERGTA